MTLVGHAIATRLRTRLESNLMNKVESMYAIMNRLSDESVKAIALWLADYNQREGK